MGSLGDYLDRLSSTWDRPSGEIPEPPEEMPQDVCPYCGGLGLVTKDVPVGDPDFGKAFVCVCRQEATAIRKSNQLRNVSNLDNHRHLTFDTFVTAGDSLNEIQTVVLRTSIHEALQYANEPQGWLLFIGGYGCGKTHLAAAVGNHRLLYDQPVIFLTVPDLLDHLRTSFGPNSEQGYDEMFEQLRNAPLLILDDLGSESQTAWANEKLYQLLNHRYTRRLPTVITTNCEMEDLDPRIASRVVDRHLTKMISMAGLPDYRQPPGTQSLTEILTANIYINKTFENFVINRAGVTSDAKDTLAQAHRAAKDFAMDPHKWVVLVGKNGCGKTHLAAATANARSKTGEVAYFITLPNLLDNLRKTFETGSRVTLEKRFQEVCMAPVLILDHFDLSAASPWAREKLFQLIEYRYVQTLPTMITKPGDSLEDIDMVFRVRFSDTSLCEVIHITAPEYKGGVSQIPNAHNKPNNPKANRGYAK